MRFKNLKASDLEGRLDLPGLASWLEGLSAGDAAILIAAPAGTGKTAAVGAIARKLQREDVMQCDLLQVFEYPDSKDALRSILTIAENLRATIFHADGIDRLCERYRQAGDAEALGVLPQWLAGKKERLRQHGVTFIATGRKAGAIPEDLRAEFEKTFPPGG